MKAFSCFGIIMLVLMVAVFCIAPMAFAGLPQNEGTLIESLITADTGTPEVVHSVGILQVACVHCLSDNISRKEFTAVDSYENTLPVMSRSGTSEVFKSVNPIALC